MKDLKEELIGILIDDDDKCPYDIGLKHFEDIDCRNGNCTDCWRYALENIDIVEREESK